MNADSIKHSNPLSREGGHIRARCVADTGPYERSPPASVTFSNSGQTEIGDLASVGHSALAGALALPSGRAHAPPQSSQTSHSTEATRPSGWTALGCTTKRARSRPRWRAASRHGRGDRPVRVAGSRALACPAGVAVVDHDAFRGRAGIEAVAFSASTIVTGAEAFRECGTATAADPPQSESIGLPHVASSRVSPSVTATSHLRSMHSGSVNSSRRF